MRLFAPAPGFAALGMLAWGCSFYGSGLLPSSDEPMGDGATASGGRSGSSNSSGSTSGAKPGTAGTTGDLGGTFSSGGTDVGPTEAGADNQGGESSTGVAGSAGTSAGGTAGSGNGGKAGSGGAAGGGGQGGNAGISGNGGASGSMPDALCTEHPIPAKMTWIPTASISSPGNGTESDPLYNPPSHLIDGLTGKRWSTGQEQTGVEGAEWIQIDFGVVVGLNKITLQVVGNDINDYPRGWAVRVSNTDKALTAPINASGVGAPGNTLITLPTTATGRYLLISQTGVADKWWTVAELLVACTN